MRHAQVENPRQILYGRLPKFSISEEGKRKVKEAATFFKTQGITSIYSSPMRRTRQTAAIVGESLKITPRTSPLLLETRLALEGISLEEYRRDYQKRMYSETFVKKGQESVVSQYARMRRFVDIVTARHSGETILAVSHGDPILILRAGMENIPFTWEWKHANYLTPASWFVLKFSENTGTWE